MQICRVKLCFLYLNNFVLRPIYKDFCKVPFPAKILFAVYIFLWFFQHVFNVFPSINPELNTSHSKFRQIQMNPLLFPHNFI